MPVIPSRSGKRSDRLSRQLSVTVLFAGFKVDPQRAAWCIAVDLAAGEPEQLEAGAADIGIALAVALDLLGLGVEFVAVAFHEYQLAIGAIDSPINAIVVPVVLSYQRPILRHELQHRHPEQDLDRAFREAGHTRGKLFLGLKEAVVYGLLVAHCFLGLRLCS
jgi:hypothetical protein